MSVKMRGVCWGGRGVSVGVELNCNKLHNII